MRSPRHRVQIVLCIAQVDVLYAGDWLWTLTVWRFCKGYVDPLPGCRALAFYQYTLLPAILARSCAMDATISVHALYAYGAGR